MINTCEQGVAARAFCSYTVPKQGVSNSCLKARTLLVATQVAKMAKKKNPTRKKERKSAREGIKNERRDGAGGSRTVGADETEFVGTRVNNDNAAGASSGCGRAPTDKVEAAGGGVGVGVGIGSRSHSRPLLSFPYEVDYCDHFETPLRAYEDVLPLLDLLTHPHDGVGGVGGGKGRRSDLVLYDPYYCAGRSLRLLNSLGFDGTIHEKRDFYADASRGSVPDHDALITNPPYSGDHKERCIEFALEGLRGGGPDSDRGDGGTGRLGRPFFLLLPNYIATKEYWRDKIGSVVGEEEPGDIVYVVPAEPYEYDHPEGTGHETSPFASIWFCGIPSELVPRAREAYVRQKKGVAGLGTAGGGGGVVRDSPRV